MRPAASSVGGHQFAGVPAVVGPLVAGGVFVVAVDPEPVAAVALGAGAAVAGAALEDVVDPAVVVGVEVVGLGAVAGAGVGADAAGGGFEQVALDEVVLDRREVAVGADVG